MPFRSMGSTLVAALTLAALATVAGASPAPEQGTEDAVATALAHLQANPAELEVTRADVADLAVTSAYESAHNRITHVNLNQQHKDLEVFGGHATVNVGPDGRVVFAAGSLVSDLGARATGNAELEATEAVEAPATAPSATGVKARTNSGRRDLNGIIPPGVSRLLGGGDHPT